MGRGGPGEAVEWAGPMGSRVIVLVVGGMLGLGGRPGGSLGGWRHAWVAEAVGAGPSGGLLEGRVDG